jgi:hypothetical protein
MDPSQFDALSRTVASGVSRRQAVAKFGVAGVLAGLSGVLGRQRTAAAVPIMQNANCRLEIFAAIRLGPSAGVILDGSVPGELRGRLNLAIGADGAIDNGRFRLEGGAELPVVGQADGRTLNLRVDVATDQTLIFVGTAAQRLEQCTGDIDGLLTGPRVGDLGDWHATATALGGGEGSPPGATATASPTSGAPAATSTPSGSPTATAPTGATPTSTATATVTPTATATETPTPVPTETPTPAPTETPTPLPIVCPTGTTDCGGVCLDLQTDVNNCGACGNVCPEAQPGFDVGCAGGNCFFMREPACAEGLSSCNGVCVNRQTDPANCGLCGNVCAAGEICFGGLCAREHRCDTGLTNCNDVCVDLLIDPANCGICGHVCAAGEICFGGLCARDNRT